MPRHFFRVTNIRPYSEGSVPDEVHEKRLLKKDELVLFQDVGPRNIDVIVYKGYEHRRERGSQCHKFNQKWVCRHARKTNCKGRYKLTVQDLVNFFDEASISSFCDHNHEPLPLTDIASKTRKDASKLITQGGVSTGSVEMPTSGSTLLTILEDDIWGVVMMIMGGTIFTMARCRHEKDERWASRIRAPRERSPPHDPQGWPNQPETNSTSS